MFNAPWEIDHKSSFLQVQHLEINQVIYREEGLDFFLVKTTSHYADRDSAEY